MNAWKLEKRMSTYAISDDKHDLAYIGVEPAFFEGVPCGSVTTMGRTAEELLSIATLITAAPELLALVEMVAAGNTESRYLELLAAQVIDKARGNK